MNTLLFKNIISHSLFSKGWGWLCVRDELETGTHCYIDPTVLLSHLVWVAQPWVTEGSKPSVCKLILTLASYLQLTRTVCALVILLFNAHLLPLFFRLFTQVHLLIDGLVEGQYITSVGRSELTLGLCKNSYLFILFAYSHVNIHI